MPGEFNFFQAAVAIELDRKMNLVATGRIVSMHFDRGFRQFAVISRTSGMVEDHFLIKFVELAEFRVHLKKAMAFCRMSIIRLSRWVASWTGVGWTFAGRDVSRLNHSVAPGGMN